MPGPSILPNIHPTSFLRDCTSGSRPFFPTPHNAIHFPLGVRTHYALPSEQLVAAESQLPRSQERTVFKRLLRGHRRAGGSGRPLVVTGADVALPSVHLLQAFPREDGVAYSLLPVGGRGGELGGGWFEEGLVDFPEELGVVALQELYVFVGGIGQHDFLSVDLLDLIDGLDLSVLPCSGGGLGQRLDWERRVGLGLHAASNIFILVKGFTSFNQCCSSFNHHISKNFHHYCYTHDDTLSHQFKSNEIIMNIICLFLGLLVAVATTNTTCASSQYFNTNLSLCLNCPTGCSACCDEAVCSACITGYALASASGTCLQCPFNCNSCDENYTCLACSNNTYTVNGVCVGCPAGCSICPDPNTCSVCSEGYYSFSSAVCKACPSGCRACTFTSTYRCSGCRDGYYLNSSNLCAQCVSPCGTCSSGGCSSCQSGFFFTGSSCLSCINNCLSCTNASACTQCTTGTVLSQGTCVTCPSNCNTCLNSTFCTQCNSNYAVNGGLCVGCTLPCLSCQSVGVCLSCTTGYYLSGSACLPCLTNCLSCSSSDTCSVCTSGYYFNGLSCSSCPQLCATCNNAGTCTKCAQGNYLSNNECLTCTALICSCTAIQNYLLIYTGSPHLLLAPLALLFFFLL